MKNLKFPIFIIILLSLIVSPHNILAMRALKLKDSATFRSSNTITRALNTLNKSKNRSNQSEKNNGAPLPKFNGQKALLASVCVGVAAGSFAYYTKHNEDVDHTRLLDYYCDLIKNNPEKAHEIALSMKEKYYEELEARQGFGKVVKELTVLYEKKCPIFKLSECSTPICGLTRKLWPEYRKAYENKMIEACIQKISSTDNQVHYTSFGPGGLLQDLIILLNVLEQKPKASLVINLIDPQSQPILAYKLLKNEPQEIKTEDIIDVESIKDYVQIIRDNHPEATLSTDEEIKDNGLGCYLESESKVKQFLTILKHSAPHAKINVIMHQSSKSYLEYLKTHSMPYPDILTAADIQDEMSYAMKGPEKYTLLCQEVLKHKPSAINIWLHHHPLYLNSATLQTLSLEPQEQWQECTAENKIQSIT